VNAEAGLKYIQKKKRKVNTQPAASSSSSSSPHKSIEKAWLELRIKIDHKVTQSSNKN
jgi:hypothetical protein